MCGVPSEIFHRGSMGASKNATATTDCIASTQQSWQRVCAYLASLPAEGIEHAAHWPSTTTIACRSNGIVLAALINQWGQRDEDLSPNVG